MKKIFIVTLLFLTGIIFSANVAFADVWVNGYYRSNGTFVEGYYRSSPDSDPTNNFSYPGNTNPYTGAVAPGNPDTYINNYQNSGSSGNSTKAGWDKLDKENEALRKSIEATELKNKIDSLSNQINQLKQNSGDSCTALLNLSSNPPLTCSDRQYQSILQEKESAKSSANSLLWTQGLVGNQEIKASRMAEIDAKYDPQLASCKSLQTYNSNSMREYEQCKINRSNSQAELQRLQQQYQETNKMLETNVGTQGKTSTSQSSNEPDDQFYTNICRKVNTHYIYKSTSMNTGECVCETGYSSDPVKYCVPKPTTIMSVTEWKEAGQPDQNGVVTQPTKVPVVTKPSTKPTTTPKKTTTDSSLSTSTTSTSTPTAVLATTTPILSSSSTLPVQVLKQNDKQSVIQKLSGWFIKLFR